MTYEPNPASGENQAYGPFDAKSGDKGFAALTAGLLARKGEAEPALEPFAHARVASGSARQMQPGSRHDINRQAANDSPPIRTDEQHEFADEPDPVAARANPFPDFEPQSPAAPASNSASVPQVDDAPRFVRPKSNPVTTAAPVDQGFGENCPRKKMVSSRKRAAVTFRMSVHDFLRLKLAAAELEMASQEIVIDAIEAYLDAQGVERLDDCKCLREAANVCSEKAETD